jgi:hypothetical protein
MHRILDAEFNYFHFATMVGAVWAALGVLGNDAPAPSRITLRQLPEASHTELKCG